MIGQANPLPGEHEQNKCDAAEHTRGLVQAQSGMTRQAAAACCGPQPQKIAPHRPTAGRWRLARSQRRRPWLAGHREERPREDDTSPNLPASKGIPGEFMRAINAAWRER